MQEYNKMEEDQHSQVKLKQKIDDEASNKSQVSKSAGLK